MFAELVAIGGGLVVALGVLLVAVLALSGDVNV